MTKQSRSCWLVPVPIGPVTRTSVKHGGRPIEWLGDGVMVRFRDPGRAVVAALDMVDDVPAVGDYFGRTVNLASRIAGCAPPCEVLVTQEAINGSSGSGCRLTEIRAIRGPAV